MKTKIPCLLAALLTLAACSDNQPPAQNAGASTAKSSSHSDDEDDSDKPPFIGMTKQQARARYGDPNRETTTEEGETWIYVRGIGSAMAKAAIPFYVGGRDIKTGSLVFGANGKVKKFTWDTKTDD